MKTDRQPGDIALLIWLALLVALVCAGCANQYPVGPMGTDFAPVETEPDTVAVAFQDTVPAPVPPPIVPAGVDTAFVEDLDDEYGILFNQDELDDIHETMATLEQEVESVDTLASVIRFLRAAERPDDDVYLSAQDSQAVGRILLRALAPSGPESQIVDRLDAALDVLRTVAEEVDSVNAQIQWKRDGSDTREQNRRLKLAIHGFSREGQALRDQLNAIMSNLKGVADRSDSNRSFLRMERQLAVFKVKLDNTIKEVGQTAQNIKANSPISSDALIDLQRFLDEKRQYLIEFEAIWSQLSESGGLDLANPERPFDSKRMERLLEDIGRQYAELADRARIKASVSDTASSWESQYDANTQAREFIDEILSNLRALRNNLERVNSEFSNLGNRYWGTRLRKERDDRNARERLYQEVDEFIDKHESTARIRESADLLAAYTRLSNRAINKWQEHIVHVGDHDGERQAAQRKLANILGNRARVMGTPSAYDDARNLWNSLYEELPGVHAYPYYIGQLYWDESLEDRTPATSESMRRAALRSLQECESTLLETFSYEATMDTIATGLMELAADQDQDPSGATIPAAFNLPEIQLPEANYYFKNFFPAARADLEALGPAVQDSIVRQWLYTLDLLRRQIAYENDDGDDYFFRFARYLYLQNSVSSGDERMENIRYWSWDDGNLALRKRLQGIYALPDSTKETAAVKRDSLVDILAQARTEGARRQLQYQIGFLEFQNLEQYDVGLDRLFKTVAEIGLRPNPNPEVSNIDSIVTRNYPTFLYNRGNIYKNTGLNREAFYCFLGVSEKYGIDPVLRYRSKYQAAQLLKDNNQRKAVSLLDEAIQLAVDTMERDPQAVEIRELVSMFEMSEALNRKLKLLRKALQAKEYLSRLEAAAAADVSGEPGK